MYYLGIDVHKRESHVAVLDEDGEVDREIRVGVICKRVEHLERLSVSMKTNRRGLLVKHLTLTQCSKWEHLTGRRFRVTLARCAFSATASPPTISFIRMTSENAIPCESFGHSMSQPKFDDEVADYQLKKEQILQFHRTGHLGPFYLCSPNEMADIRENIDEEISADEGPRDNRHMYRHLDCPSVYKLCSSPMVAGRVQSLIGSNLLLWASTLFEKMPEMSDFAWHQDTKYFDLEPPVNVTAWIALTESTIENGCMQIIPGSHQDNIPHVKDSSREIFDIKADPDYVDSDQAVDIELKPGEFILFNERLLHRSRENETNQRRFGLSARITVPFSRVNTKDTKIVIAGEDQSEINKTTQPPV